jgi:hypothetical protein
LLTVKYLLKHRTSPKRILDLVFVMHTRKLP